MATSPRSGKADNGAKQETGAKTAALEDLDAQIRILREEMARLSKEISGSRDRSMEAAKRAAADSIEHLRAQGEAAVEGLRTNAKDIEQQFETAVRDKPFTALAIAAGVGFLFALMARR